MTDNLYNPQNNVAFNPLDMKNEVRMSINGVHIHVYIYDSRTYVLAMCILI